MPPKRKRSQIIAPESDEAAVAICTVIRRIPRGWVATYGQVAAMPACQGEPALSARCFSSLPGNRHSVASRRQRKGRGSYALSRNGGDALQQRLLEKEGVEFDNRNRFDLERFRWPE
jgi:methylated-DNA-protein-cysteine methyltransferase-like protein